MPSHDGNPLLIPGNIAAQLAELTRQYNRSKADHEAMRDRWQTAIYDAWDAGASIANLADWVGVSQARIGTILSRITAVRQREAADAASAGVPLLAPQRMLPAA